MRVHIATKSEWQLFTPSWVSMLENQIHDAESCKGREDSKALSIHAFEALQKAPHQEVCFAHLVLLCMGQTKG